MLGMQQCFCDCHVAEFGAGEVGCCPKEVFGVAASFDQVRHSGCGVAGGRGGAQSCAPPGRGDLQALEEVWRMGGGGGQRAGVQAALAVGAEFASLHPLSVGACSSTRAWWDTRTRCAICTRSVARSWVLGQGCVATAGFDSTLAEFCEGATMPSYRYAGYYDGR